MTIHSEYYFDCKRPFIIKYICKMAYNVIGKVHLCLLVNNVILCLGIRSNTFECNVGNHDI